MELDDYKALTKREPERMSAKKRCGLCIAKMKLTDAARKALEARELGAAMSTYHLLRPAHYLSY